MDAFERLETAIAGKTPDRIPVSLWFHFGSEHLPPETVARLHIEFYRTYRWDFLKVMFDYRLELPATVDAGHGIDLDTLLWETDWQAPFARQRDCLAILKGQLGDEVPLVETVYSPFMYLLRHVGHDHRQSLLDRPEPVAAILDRLCEEACRHVDALKEPAVYGVFFATTAGSTVAGSSELALQAPRDRTVLDRASGLKRFLHLHGAGASAADLADYPREVLHSDGNDLAELRKGGEKAIMGGLPHASLTRMSLASVRSQIAGAIDSAGRAGFILAPGCSVSPSLARRTMLAIRNSEHLDTTAS
ncbi:MAG: hypothetical protein KIT43_01390 [Bauldia sp.]|nr:hypothetical protein [Bauldia sp.]